MANQQKVREWMRASDSAAMFETMTTIMLEQVAIDDVRDGSMSADDQSNAHQFRQRMMARLSGQMLDQFINLACPEFTDDEMDQLIEINLRDVTRKLREFMPIAQQQLMVMITDKTIDLEAVALEVLDELKIAPG